MLYIFFDTEVYKTTNGTVDFFIICKSEDNLRYFRDPFEFLDFINLESRRVNQPVVLVGFNCLEYDFTMITIWVALIKQNPDMSAEDINVKLRSFSKFWIERPSWSASTGENFYNTVKYLAPVDAVPEITFDDVENLKGILRNGHPNFKAKALFNLSSMASDGDIFIFDEQLVYTSGNLKVRSLVEDIKVFRSSKIVDFDYDSEHEVAIIEEYAKADIDATVELFYLNNDCKGYIEACYQTIKKYGLENRMSLINSTLVIKAISDIKNYFSPLPAETEGSINSEFLEWEKKLMVETGINFYDQKHYFMKEIKGRRFPKFSINLRNDKGGLILGGIHEAEDYSILETRDQTICFEIDFSSLYPYVMTSEKCPVTTLYGKEQIKSNIKNREIAKKNNHPSQAVFKLINNSCFGLTSHFVNSASGGNYNTLKSYSYTQNYIIRLAQVSIIQLIQFLIDEFEIKDQLKICNVNTDSVMAQVTGRSKEEIIAIVDKFNAGFKLHDSVANLKFYKNLIVFNTNGYIKVSEKLELDYKGSKFNSVRINFSKGTGLYSPLFVNAKTIFFKYLEYLYKQDISLKSVEFLTALEPFLEEFLKTNQVILYDKNRKVTYIDEINGEVINNANIESNSFTVSNFRYTERGSTPLEFCSAFFSNILSHFFKLDYTSIIEDLKMGNCLSESVYGKDFIRAKNLVNTDVAPVKFVNSLIHKVYDNTDFTKFVSEASLGKKLKIENLKFENPVELLNFTINNLSSVLTPKQIEDKKFNSLLPIVYDFDFKGKHDQDLEDKDRESLIKELQEFYNANKSCVLLIEWQENNSNYNKYYKNGVHVIVLGLLSNKKVLKDIVTKYSLYLDDKICPTGSISLYTIIDNKTRRRLGSVEILTEYIAKLSSFLYPTVEEYETNVVNNEIVSNAQIVGGYVPDNIEVANLEEKYKNYVNPFTRHKVTLTEEQQRFIDLTINRCSKNFSPVRDDWFKEIGQVKMVLRFLMSNLGFNDEDELTKEFIYDVLLKLCLYCKISGISTNGFRLQDVIHSCRDQVYATYGIALGSLVSVKSRKYFNVFADLYDINGDNLHALKNTNVFQLTKRLVHLYTDEEYREIKQIDELEPSLLANEVSFVEAPTGIGKTHNIVKLVCDNICNGMYLYLVFCPTISEIDQVKTRLLDSKDSVRIGVYTDPSKAEFDEFGNYDAILITSAYLCTKSSLPTELLKCIDKHVENGIKVVSIIDEVDNGLNSASVTLPLFTPYKIKECKSTHSKFDSLDLFTIKDLCGTLQDEKYAPLVKFVDIALSDKGKYVSLEAFDGYKNSNSRGSCFKGCASSQKKVYCTSLKPRGYGSYQINHVINLPFSVDLENNYIFNDGSFFERGFDELSIDEMLGDVLIDNHALSVYKPTELFYDSISIKKDMGIFSNDVYIVKINRCNFPKHLQYFANGDYPCGTYLLSYIKSAGYDNLIKQLSYSTIMLTATKDFKTIQFLNRYKVKYYQLVNNRLKLDNVTLNVMFDRKINERDIKELKEVDENVYDIKNLIFRKQSSSINDLDEFLHNRGDFVIKNELGSQITSALTTEEDADGNEYVLFPEKDTNFIGFDKCSLARAFTLRAKRIFIEFGNVGRIYDAFFINYLISQSKSITSLKDVTNLYIKYNSDCATTTTIQVMGRVLRGFKHTRDGEVNLSDRDIYLYIDSVDTISLHKIVANLIKRSNIETLNIKNGVTNKDMNYLIDLVQN